jgi:signal transduction histidine kinase
MDHVLSGVERVAEVVSALAERLGNQPADIRATARSVLEAAAGLVGAEAGSILVADRTTDELVFEHVVGPRASELIGCRIGADVGIAGRCFTSGEVIVSRDASDDPRHLPVFDDLLEFETRDMVSMPIWAPRGVRVGVLQILNRGGTAASEETIQILRVVALLASLLIESSLVQRAQRLADLADVLATVHWDFGHMTVPLVLSARNLTAALQAHLTRAEELAAGLEAAGHAKAASELRDATEEFGDRAGRCLRALDRGAERVHERAQQVARCAAGAVRRPTMAEHEIGEIVRDAAEVLSSVAQESGITLEVRECEAVSAVVDGHQLFNAVYNLLRNAIAHTPSGGRVWAGVQREEEGWYSVEVGDTGSGIPEHVRSRLFEFGPPDPRLDNPFIGTRVVGGMVRAHLGRVRVESREGAGTVVHLSLPLAPRPA